MNMTLAQKMSLDEKLVLLTDEEVIKEDGYLEADDEEEEEEEGEEEEEEEEEEPSIPLSKQSRLKLNRLPSSIRKDIFNSFRILDFSESKYACQL
jgi:hypothetical protein